MPNDLIDTTEPTTVPTEETIVVTPPEEPVEEPTPLSPYNALKEEIKVDKAAHTARKATLTAEMNLECGAMWDAIMVKENANRKLKNQEKLDYHLAEAAKLQA